MNFWSSCFHLPSDGIIGVCYYAQLYEVLGLNQGFVRDRKAFYQLSLIPASNLNSNQLNTNINCQRLHVISWYIASFNYIKNTWEGWRNSWLVKNPGYYSCWRTWLWFPAIKLKFTLSETLSSLSTEHACGKTWHIQSENKLKFDYMTSENVKENQQYATWEKVMNKSLFLFLLVIDCWISWTGYFFGSQLSR